MVITTQVTFKLLSDSADLHQGTSSPIARLQLLNFLDFSKNEITCKIS